MFTFPPQRIAESKKTLKWRKANIDWLDTYITKNRALINANYWHDKSNYDFMSGRINLADYSAYINPTNTITNTIPNNIQHYPIINNKINVLYGEEINKKFNFKVVVTNQNDVSRIEQNKKASFLKAFQQQLQNTTFPSDEEKQKELEKLSKYYLYEWQDLLEMQANSLLHHYVEEYNIRDIFNKGFLDGLIVGKEFYQCDIVSGEPIIKRIDPLKIKIFSASNSTYVEDADMIVIEDYLSLGQIYDTYYTSLTKKDLESLENLLYIEKQFDDDKYLNAKDEYLSEDQVYNIFNVEKYAPSSVLDENGNIRVLQVYWKSRRRIKRVKSYNAITGNEEYNFYTETHLINENFGEEEVYFYVNEAWEGTKIGQDIYINMRPRPIQYNRMSNPSKCHFGIIGDILSFDNIHPYSIVDLLKPFNYLYDVVHDRLITMLARNWGKIIKLDLSRVPKGWDVDKWLYYAKNNGLAVEDSFKEGDYGLATGKIAASFPYSTSRAIDAETGNSIAQYIHILEYIKQEMADVIGITKQREGVIANRESVGGVERSVLQSSYITDWVFSWHKNIKKRVLECFLDTAKICLKTYNKKFQHILSDNSMTIVSIDPSTFTLADYGLIITDNIESQQFEQQIHMLGQAALQNHLLDFSTLMKMYTSSSLAEKIKIVEASEQNAKEQAAQQQQNQQQILQQQQQMLQQEKAKELELKEKMHQSNNETRIKIAEIQANAKIQSNMADLSNAPNMLDEDEIEDLTDEEKKEALKMFENGVYGLKEVPGRKFFK